MRIKLLKISDYDPNTPKRPIVKAKDITELYPDPKEREKAILASAEKVIQQHKKELIQLANK